MKRAALAAILLLASTTGAFAQQQLTTDPPSPRKHERYFFGGAAYASSYDDEGALGSGVQVEGGVGYRLTEKSAVEVVGSYVRHSRDLVYYTLSIDALGRTIATPYYPTLSGGAAFVLGQLRHSFSTSGLRPYVGFGAGLMHYYGQSWAAVMAPAAGDSATAPRIVKNSFAASVSAGMEIARGSRAWFAPYVTLYMANPGETGTALAATAGMRVGIR